MADSELNLDFLDAGVDLHALDELSFEGKPTVLDRLGPAHFRSKGFSFMGFLQTVYDHVAEQTASKSDAPAPSVCEAAPSPSEPAAPELATPELAVDDFSAPKPAENTEPPGISESETPVI